MSGQNDICIINVEFHESICRNTILSGLYMFIIRIIHFVCKGSGLGSHDAWTGELTAAVLQQGCSSSSYRQQSANHSTTSTLDREFNSSIAGRRGGRLRGQVGRRRPSLARRMELGGRW